VTVLSCSKLYLVDLAGSENIKRSGAEGKQQVEAGDINKSLCHLKTVIDQVFQGKKVPTYRYGHNPIAAGCAAAAAACFAEASVSGCR
jgi:hypothetical protein